MIGKFSTKCTLLSIGVALLGLSSCDEDMTDRSDREIMKEMHVDILPAELIKVRDYVPDNVVIAHRGSTFWVPEETEVAYQWARNIGVDYLELDIQRSSDGVLLALHDDNLQRTTNISMVYPDRQDAFTYELTFKELMELDAGSWFNTSSLNQARPGFAGQGVLTLEDVFMIASGKRIAMENGKRKYDYNETTKKYTFYYEEDPYDNGNRPGVYIEFKEAWMFPKIEQETYDLLDRLGWNIITKPEPENTPYYTADGKVNVGNTNGKVILQTFSKQSLQTSADVFKGQIPMCFLLWLGDGFLQNDASPRSYADAINYAVKNKAHFTGPSISGAPNNYDDILLPWQADLTHKAELKIHAYSFDSPEQMKKYYGLRYGFDKEGKPVRPLTDAMFTNRSEMTINFYIDQGVRPKNILGNDKTPQEVLDELGYKIDGGNGR